MVRSFKLPFIIIPGLISFTMFKIIDPGNFFTWQSLLPLIIKLVLILLGLTFRTGFLYIIRYRLL